MTNKRILTLITLLLFLSLLVGCILPPINHAPVITTDALPDATVGTAYTATVKATDADDDVLTFSLSGPTGMVISGAGVISGWTPTEVGTEDVTVAVTDGKDSVSADFTITVSEFELELIGIEVDPKEMVLPLAGVGVFKVTANYNDDTTLVVTDKCDYASSDNSIATVKDGKVTAVAEGTATISAFYKGKKDTLKVTVGDFVALEIIADDSLIFNVNEEGKFTVGLEANSDTGKKALSYFTLPAGTTFNYYIEGVLDYTFGAGTTEPFEVVFGDPTLPPLNDMTLDFGVTFTTAETYPILLEIWEVEAGPEKVELLGLKVITAVVVAAD